MPDTNPDPKFQLEHLPAGSAPHPCNLRFTVMMAHMAYKHEEYSGKQFANGTLSDFRFGKLRGLVLDSPTVFVIALTGSKTAKDWLSNLDMRKVRTPFGDIHSGFMRSFLEIEHEVMPYIWTLSIVDKPIVICGHSRGGALGQLLAAILHHRGTPVHSVYTFNSPKVGGQDFAEYMQRTGIPLHLVVHGNDLVSQLPPSSWGEWFRLLFLVLPVNFLFIVPLMLVSRVVRRNKHVP